MSTSATGPRSSRSQRLLTSARDTVVAGPSALAPVTTAVAALTAAAALVILQTVQEKPVPPMNRFVGQAATAILVVAAVALAAMLWRRRETTERLSAVPIPGEAGRTRTALLLAFTALMPFFLIPVYLLAARTRPTTETWMAYGFLDKRWIGWTFLVASVGAMLLVTAAQRVGAGAALRPAGWREWWTAGLRPGEDATTEIAARNRRALILRIALGALLAWYFFGPPWHLNPSPIDDHEAVPLGGVQALSWGSIPLIGAAAVQYGPGTEAFTYAYMHVIGPFSIAGLRDAFAAMHWAAATIFFTVLFARLRTGVAMVACVLSATIFPALMLFHFSGHGYSGFWGWGNLLRYQAVFVLALLLPVAVAAATRGRRLAGGALLGVGWGVGAVMAQENLVGGAIVIVVLSLLLLLSRTASLRPALDALVALAAGFALVWVPVVAYYAANHELGRFLELYTLMPKAVAAGYSNTPYLGGFNDPWGKAYYLLPFVLCAVGLLALLRLRPLTIVQSWSRERVLLVSVTVAAIVCQLGSFQRADSTHLANALLVLPAAVVLTVVYLPRLLGVRAGAARLASSAAIAAVFYVLIPGVQFRNAPAAAFDPLAARIAPPAATPHEQGPLMARRMDVMPPDGPCCTAAPMSTADLVDYMDRMHTLIGGRRVYVESWPGGGPGRLYFSADLKPAPIYAERVTMVVNQTVFDTFLRQFRTDAPKIKALVTANPGAPEIAIFTAAHPHNHVVQMPYGGVATRVILAR